MNGLSSLGYDACLGRLLCSGTFSRSFSAFTCPYHHLRPSLGVFECIRACYRLTWARKPAGSTPTKGAYFPQHRKRRWALTSIGCSFGAALYTTTLSLILAWRWCKVLFCHWVAYHGGSPSRHAHARAYTRVPILEAFEGGDQRLRRWSTG